LATGILQHIIRNHRRFLISLKITGLYPKLRPSLNVLILGASLLALFCLLFEYGFYLQADVKVFLHQLNVLVAVIFISELCLRLISDRDRRAFLKANRVDCAVTLAFLLSLLAFKIFSLLPSSIIFFRTSSFSLTKAYVISCQAYIAFSLLFRTIHLNKAVVRLKLRPPWIVFLTFITIIAIGTFLLLLPKATAVGKKTFFLDALFTATSATCVTGLIVVDTGSHFSQVGQLIILSLIQIGGLGLMTFTSFFAIAMGRELGIKDRVLLQDILKFESPGRIGRLILSIFLITFVTEIIGAILLYTQFLPETKNALFCTYTAIFHSVSAFCNAGFSLYPDSFMRYRANLAVNLIMASLIILGGLGFRVLANLSHWNPFSRRKTASLSLQTKLVLITTFSLIGLGALSLLIGETNGVLKDLSLKEKFLGVFFQSITSRTAGFNTLTISSLTNSSAFLLIIFMFIGASPGSTGGGIKTSTFATLLIAVNSMVHGKARVEAFKRTIPGIVIYQALCVVILSLVWIFICTLILSFTENALFIDIFIEELSAFGTLGLSRGLTSHLRSMG